MPLAFRAGRSAFAERVSRLLAAHWFRWFNSVAPEAAASPRHPEVIGASPMTGPSAAGYRLAHRLARDVIYQSGKRASLKARPSFASRVKTPYNWVVRRKGK